MKKPRKCKSVPLLIKNSNYDYVPKTCIPRTVYNVAFKVNQFMNQTIKQTTRD